MSEEEKIFCGKILLFGEYSILFNSKGLSIPYTHFTGQLAFINPDIYTDLDFALKSNQHLKEFHQFLLSLQSSNDMPCEMDLPLMGEDIARGLFFESNIPQGYGIGSSGALVAAVYSRYGIQVTPSQTDITQEEIAGLVRIFSKLETFFHGRSSGIDPLNSYLRHPLLIHSVENISITRLPASTGDRKGVIFLVDTGKTGRTGPLVKHFLEQMGVSGFADKLRNEYIPLVDGCISALQHADMATFMNLLPAVSAFQLKHFVRMIPANFFQAWQWGLDTGLFHLKLCGSGGGGFLLAFTDDYPASKKFFRDLHHEVIPVHRSA